MRVLDRLVVIEAHGGVQGPRILVLNLGLQLGDLRLHQLRLLEEV